MGISEVLGKGYNDLKEHPVYTIPVIALSFLTFLVVQTGSTALAVLDIFVSLYAIGATVALIGADEKGLSAALSRAGSTLPVLAIATVVYGFIVSVGSLFFILPGLYLGMRLYFYLFETVINEKGPIEALRGSWDMAGGHVWMILAVYLVLTYIHLTINVLLSYYFGSVGAAIAVPLNALFIPWSLCTFYVLYDAYGPDSGGGLVTRIRTSFGDPT